MFNKGIRKYISNPIIGLLPFGVFIILRAVNVEVQFALAISLVLAVVGELSFRTLYKNIGFNLTFYISGVSILITLIIWFFTNKYITKPFTYLVILEACIICSLMILRLSKTYITANFFRQKSLIQKALLNEFFESAALIQYGLTLHIFTILIYRQFPIGDEPTPIIDLIIYVAIPFITISLVGFYQMMKVRALASKLKKEEWLPIVTEKGEVTGKIAKNVSLNMKNKFLHPVVRVALVSNSKVFLQERPLNDILSPGKLDYPFEKYILFKHEINLAARNSIRQMLGNDVDMSISFLIKYVFENDDTKRLIFLFVANIDDENIIKREGKMTGKFWTVKQLEEGFVDEIFSECFELEFEYLKNMVLVPSDIIKPASTGTK